MNLEERIVIEPDGSIVVRSGKVEYGQGIRTGFARIISEELRVAIECVHVDLGNTDTTPWDMGTFGSMSTAIDGANLRAAAVFARDVLLERASERFGVPQAHLVCDAGTIRAPGGATLTLAELIQGNPLTGTVPELVPVANGTVAQAADIVMRFEGVDIVTGRRRYAADVRLAGMLRGAVLHGPRIDAALTSLDEGNARTMPGVRTVVRDGDFVGIVAERDEQARAAIEAMHATWSMPTTAASPITLALRADADLADTLAGAAQTHESSYHVPHVAHAALCPNCAVADVRDDGIHLYVASQRPFGLKDEIAKALHVPPGIVHVHPQAMGGMFGRGGMNDAPMEAARLSHAVRAPVLVQWTRAEEFRLSPARPMVDVTIRAGLDASGRIIAWRSRSQTNPFTYVADADPRVIEMTSGRNAVPAYAIEAIEVSLQVNQGAVRTGAFRSLAAAPNIFAIESFMDEVAELAGQDPIAFRLRHIDDPRLTRVLEAVRLRSAWTERRRDGCALGVACAVYHGTYIAQVAEVSPDPQGIRVKNIWCVADAGRLVHPDGARNQIEGGIVQATSCALFEELSINEGSVRTASWHDYPIASFLNAPTRIDVSFIGDPAVASTGIGEPGFVPTAAALANAIYGTTKKRMRHLPLLI